MITNRWMGTPCSLVEGLSQEATPRSQWPFEPDWIVRYLHHDTANGMYWVHGYLRRCGKDFHWGLYSSRPLDWRCDLSNAVFEVGRHETPAEARLRHFARKATA